MRYTLPALVLLLFLPGCGVSRTVKKVKKAVTPDDVVEKIATGDVAGLVPIVFAVLNAGQDYVVVHRDGSVVIAEVKKIPGIGISLPDGYYIRVDTSLLEGTAGASRMLFTFFKGERGNIHKVSKPDSLIGKYAQQLFGQIFMALLKAGVVFK